MNATIEKTVREIAIENPASVRVFETFGIDYCCGANRSLSDACTRANVPLDKVLDLLANSGKVHPTDGEAWNESKLSVLADHIVETHHGYVRRETPRIMALLAKVIGKHGAARPEIKEIEELFTAVTQ
jgi:regulator of cell morphogenesis and NO signaling